MSTIQNLPSELLNQSVTAIDKLAKAEDPEDTARETPAGWDDMCVCDHPRELHDGGACRGKARYDYPNRCGCTAFELAQIMRGRQVTGPEDTAMRLERIRAIVGKDKAPTLAELAACDLQRDLAKSGQAVNQCPHCGNYSIDSQPPVLHRPGCPAKVVTRNIDQLAICERFHESDVQPAVAGAQGPNGEAHR